MPEGLLRRLLNINLYAERIEEFEKYTRLGMVENSETLYAREIVIMRNGLMHNMG
jgi:hypothetical protein